MVKMADQETKEMLVKWGLEEELTDIFQENLITFDVLRLLNEGDINALIKPIGLRVKFRNCINLWRQELSASEIDVNNLDLPEEFFDLNNKILSSDNQAQSLIIDLKDLENEQESRSLVQSSDLFNSHVDYKPDFVSKVLEESIDGRGILAAGKKGKGLLCESHRKQLGRLIINHLLLKNPNQKIQSSQFINISRQIQKLFMKEVAALYFTSSISATKFQKKRNASGILYEAYISRRRKLRVLGEIESVRSCSSASNISHSSTSTGIDSDTTDTDIIDGEDKPGISEHLNWLHNSIEPWGLVDLYWQETATVRSKLLENEQCNVTEYFNKYPALKQQNGYTLLLHDFDVRYPTVKHSLYNSIILIKDLIIKLAIERRRTSRDITYKNQVDEYLTAAAEPAAESAATLLLLPYLLSVPAALKKPGKPVWKPSRTEVRDAFITHVASEADILPTIEARKNKYTDLGRTFQPLVLIAGPSLEKISKSVVAIDNTVYSFSCPVEAVDAAFKIFHATGALYPEEAAELWLFIQRAFYKLTTRYDRFSQSIKHLLTNFNIPF